MEILDANMGVGTGAKGGLAPVVIALCPTANCYDWFSAAPNAILYHAQWPVSWDYDSKPTL